MEKQELNDWIHGLELYLVGTNSAEFATLSDKLKAQGCVVLHADADSLTSMLGSHGRIVVIDLDAISPEQLELLPAHCGRGQCVPIAVATPIGQMLVKLARLNVQDILFKPVCDVEFMRRLQVAVRRWQWQSAIRETSSPNERSRAVRREGALTAHGQPYPTITIDEREKRVVLGRTVLRLSPKEYDFLRLLASDAGRVFSVAEIVRVVWGEGSRAGAEDVHEYVHLLRKKVEIDPSRPQILLTVKGFGYRIDENVDVELREDSTASALWESRNSRA
jgi:DNA-binding response OmpR family regulator